MSDEKELKLKEIVSEGDTSAFKEMNEQCMLNIIDNFQFLQEKFKDTADEDVLNSMRLCRDITVVCLKYLDKTDPVIVRAIMSAPILLMIKSFRMIYNLATCTTVGRIIDIINNDETDESSNDKFLFKEDRYKDVEDVEDTIRRL